MDIEIRRATPDDAEAIAEVHVASWRTTYEGIVDPAIIDSLSVSERAESWRQRLMSTEASAPDILVALTRETGIVGFVSGGAIRDPVPGFDGELYAIYLLEGAQREGIGRALVRHWAIAALERGLRSAVVRVLADNPACKFYERLGAIHLRDGEHVVGGKSYPERLYGWKDLRPLAS